MLLTDFPLTIISRGVGKEGLKPHPLFDPAWYLKENPEIAKTGVEPLHHYVTSGWREGRSPHPLFDVRYYQDKQAKELVEKGIEPITHFRRARCTR